MHRQRKRSITAASLLTTLLFGACTPTPERRDGGRPDAFVRGDAGTDAARDEVDAAEPVDAAQDAPPDGGGIVDDMTPTMPYEGPVEGLVSGTITIARTTDPLAGARITVSGSTVEATSDATGNFALNLAPGDYVLHFSHDGYLEAHRRVRVLGWERIAIRTALLPAGPTMAVPRTGGTVTVDSTRVNFPPGSVTDASGTPISTGTVTVTPIDPRVSLEGSPGDFEGAPTMGETTPIVSYGMVDIAVNTPTGPGGIAMGTPATIEVPVGTLPAGDPPLAEGDCMPLWRFDTERAIWVEEGQACAVRAPGGGLVLTGNVGQPGVWNCDRPVMPVCYTGTVTDCGGVPVPGAEIHLTGGSVTSSTTTTTDREGHFEVRGAARLGAIIEATVMVSGNRYVEQTDFINGNASTCTPAPTLTFPFRYVTGTVTGTGQDSFVFSGGSERTATSRTGGARFWDVARGPVPYTLTCSDAPTNAFETPPADLMPTPASIDVGNPVTLTTGGTTTDLFRTRIASRVSGYLNNIDRPLPIASAFDVDIRGAAGAMPRAHLPAALQMPSPTFAVSSPATGAMRSYPATRIPLRWTTAADGGEVSVMIFSIADRSRVAYARLIDDGSEDISLAGFPTIRGAVTIWVTRSVRRFERLPIGPAVQLIGAQRFVFDATIL